MAQKKSRIAPDAALPMAGRDAAHLTPGGPIRDPRTRVETGWRRRLSQNGDPHRARAFDQGQRATVDRGRVDELAHHCRIRCSDSVFRTDGAVGAAPRVADEGLARTLWFVANVVRDGDARTRVRGMRSTFRKHRENLAAISVIAVKPD